MSGAPTLRRRDKEMSEAAVDEMLATSYCGRLATVGTDGSPYVCPLLYVWMDRTIWLHNTSARGHLQDNVRHAPRVCFEVDAPGQVYSYGRYQCDTALEYRSVIVFGTIRIVEDRPLKAAFFDALMAKYSAAESGRPKGFYPRLDNVTTYAVAVDRMSGKQTSLPAVEGRWPAVDRTMSPDAVPPPAGAAT